MFLPRARTLTCTSGLLSHNYKAILAHSHILRCYSLYHHFLFSLVVRTYTDHTMPKAGFYAVRIGKSPGIYTTWEDCRDQVYGYPRARYKKLRTLEEAEAWIQEDPDRSYLIRPENRPPGPAWASFDSQTARQSSTPSSSAIMNTPIVQPGSRLQPVSELRTAIAGPSSSAMVEEVYTDGACSNNGQVGPSAGIGVWWGPSDPRNLCERCPGAQTNNRAELIAILRALQTASINLVPLLIKSDSLYAIKCFNEWLPSWRQRNFTTSSGTPVKNVELIMYVDALLSMRRQSGQQVRLTYVRGHAGETGNDGADALAVRGAGLPKVEEPDWVALRLRLEKAPVRSTLVAGHPVDASMYAEMILGEKDLIAELEAN
ncbi:ribonuclease H-like domain-containing protein [Multifurca ochricompacta]|uniref:ribonuclease H n=1 Tax=Multifurca ochricompacta TaxID=376703 RepID=A0AAD4QM41_9AGAM|nr:ribonuclease H-like domain-containing protein [Multifurca ochricompacta]